MLDPSSILPLVLNGLSDPNLFPKIDIVSCFPVSSLHKLLRSPPIQKLTEFLNAALLNPKIGFNMGTMDISVTLTLPQISQFEHCPRQAVIWVMLGLFQEQSLIEDIWVQKKEGENGESLANKCLTAFMDQTAVAITQKSVDYNQGSIHLRFDSVNKRIIQVKEGILYTDRMQLPFKYSPTYYLLSGYNLTQRMYSKETLLVQQEELVGRLLKEFWHLVSQQRYFPDPSLYESVNTFLLSYLKSGLCGQSATFTPQHTSPGLYLHGIAGIGKSSFVRLFCDIFKKVIHKHVEPNKRFEVVRVPLNSMTPGDLRKILHVRGISDWSVERIVEQTVARGGVAMLHLEENPEEEGNQEMLIGMTRQMLKAITSRYHEYESNIFYVITSNYPPAASIAKSVIVVPMAPPSLTVQREWCVRVLEDAVNSGYVGAPTVTCSFEEDTLPPPTNDMRSLEKWKMCFSYLLVRHLHTTLAGGRLDHVHLMVKGNFKQLKVGFRTVPEVSVPYLDLFSRDGFFLFRNDPQQTEHYTPLSGGGHIPMEKCPHVALIIDMLRHGFLKPAVLVLSGSNTTKRMATETAIIEYLQTEFGSKLICTTVTAKQDSDKESIFGNPSDPVLRGLFRWIDDLTNPIYPREDMFGLVVVRANEMGQFMIRELLETADSKTHRNSIRKDRIVFLVNIEEGEVSPQLLSRAHEVIS